jgi:hypothetical protein
MVAQLETKMMNERGIEAVDQVPLNPEICDQPEILRVE